jgi:hypothetical protein
MLKLMILVVVAFAISAQAQHHHMSKCIDQQLASCQTKFNTLLGIEGDADWHDPSRLSYAIFKLFMKGTDGLLEVCNARTKFYQCLGPTYYSCINPLYFLEHHFTTQQSYGFVGVMHSLHYTCGGGLDLSIENWGCILRTFQKQGPALDACVQTWNNTIITNPDQFCPAAQTFLDCYRKPFGTECSYNNEASYWGCEYIYTSALLEQSFCPTPLSCKVQQSADEHLLATSGQAQAEIDHQEQTIKMLSSMQAAMAGAAIR